MAHFKKLLFGPKTFFGIKLLHANGSILCRQSIELFQHKLWYKLNSPHMHYLYTSYKIAKLDKQPFS